MTAARKNLRTCPNGHTYYKSSDCSTCPVCENQYKPMSGFLSKLSAPARRAFGNKQITFLQKLSEFKQAEILKPHVIEPTTVAKLQEALQAEGLSFKQ